MKDLTVTAEIGDIPVSYAISHEFEKWLKTQAKDVRQSGSSNSSAYFELSAGKYLDDDGDVYDITRTILLSDHDPNYSHGCPDLDIRYNCTDIDDYSCELSVSEYWLGIVVKNIAKWNAEGAEL